MSETPLGKPRLSDNPLCILHLRGCPTIVMAHTYPALRERWGEIEWCLVMMMPLCPWPVADNMQIVWISCYLPHVSQLFEGDVSDPVLPRHKVVVSTIARDRLQGLFEHSGSWLCRGLA